MSANCHNQQSNTMSVRGRSTSGRGSGTLGGGGGGRGLGSSAPRRRRHEPDWSSLSSPTSLLSFGLKIAGFGKERQRCRKELSVQRFRAHYGVSHEAIAHLIEDLRKHQPEEVVEVTLLLMGVYWLKVYTTEEVMAGRWGYDEKYCREHSRKYVLRIAALKPVKITFRGLDPRCKYVPVDGVHVRTQEFRCNPSSSWWSVKHNGPGVGFEVCCDPTNKGRILHATRAAPAGVHDLTRFRGGKKNDKKNWKKDSLYFKLPDGVKAVGDSGYAGQPDKVVVTTEAHAAATKQLFARMKSMQETCFKRMKHFNVLSTTFRHGAGTSDKLQKVGDAFDAIAVLTQYDIEHGHPLFKV